MSGLGSSIIVAAINRSVLSVGDVETAPSFFQELEAQIPRQPERMSPFKWFLILCVGFYMGDPQPGQSMATAYAQALGYPGPYELRLAMHANNPDFKERRIRAIHQVLAKFGVRIDDDPEALAQAFNRMWEGLSKSYKKFLAALDGSA